MGTLFLFLTPFLVFGILPVPFSPLRIGDFGDNVYYLQKILNLDKDTKVSTSGAGSPGNETKYFGPATKNAVERFQEKYKNEVLLPAGLSSPSGYVGSLTISKLKNIAQFGVLDVKKTENVAQNKDIFKKEDNKSQNTVTFLPVDQNTAQNIWVSDRWYEDIGKKANSLASNAIASQKEVNLGEIDFVTGAPKVLLSKTSSVNFYWGKEAGISGSGFSKTGNKIYFSDKYFIDNISSKDGGTISFVMPNIPKGHYRLLVNSLSGFSNSIPVFVADSNSKKVILNSVSPSSMSVGQSAKIEGSGFLAVNDLITSFGVIKNVPSYDGNTISFTLDSDMFLEYKKNGKKFDKIWNVAIYVSNKDGVSENPIFFDLNL